jgi:hypothetical protein
MLTIGTSIQQWQLPFRLALIFYQISLPKSARLSRPAENSPEHFKNSQNPRFSTNCLTASPPTATSEN